MRDASKFFRDNGYQSRPTQCHGIDLVTDKPHIVAEHVSAEKFEEILKPGMIIMAEPNPITPDGMFGIFLGHTFIVTKDGHEVVDKFPLEIAVAKGELFLLPGCLPSSPSGALTQSLSRCCSQGEARFTPGR